jgi:predicted transcriptional regulator
MTPTGFQIRAARTLIGLNQDELAKAAGLTVQQALIKMEKSGKAKVASRKRTIERVLTCLAQHGVALTLDRIIHATCS